MTRTRCDRTPAWAALQIEFAARGRAFDLRQAFAADANRFERFSLSAPHVFADLSKNHVDAATEVLLQALAQQTGLAAHRDAMFRGEHINVSEDRAVMHWLLRQPAGSLNGDLAAPLAEVHDTLNAMLAYAEALRADAQITDVVNIGIGGSDLGPQMAVLALHDCVVPGKRFHFVSNVDGHELAGVLKGLKSESTLFLIASKTFTTIETMTNAHSALQWFKAQGGHDVALHFAALQLGPPAPAMHENARAACQLAAPPVRLGVVGAVSTHLASERSVPLQVRSH
jgi:glucose-6-phosphate isomerase